MKYLSCIWWYMLMACIVCLLPYTGWSQSNNKQKAITPTEYNKWCNLENNGLSAEGSWIGYSLYNTESETLIIQQTHGNKKYVMDHAGSLKFLGDSIASYNQNERSYLMFLNSDREEVFPSGTGFQISNNEQYLLVFHKSSERLLLRSLQNNDSLSLTGVSAYCYNPVSEGICVLSSGTDADKINIFSLRKGYPVRSVPIPHNRQVLELTWHSSGNFLAFILGPVQNLRDTTDVGLVGYYDLNKEKSRYLNPVETGKFPREHILVSLGRYPLEFSPDGKRIFFAHKPEKTITDMDIPEIWRTDDPYVRQRMSVWSYNIPKISMWDPAGNKYIQVTDQNTPEAFYGMSKDYVLIYNPAQYRLKNDPLIDTFDVYIMDMESGEKKLLIKKLVNTVGSLNISPSGRYVLYFKDRHRWCYDTRKDLHDNLTEKLEKVSGIKGTEDILTYSQELWMQDDEAVFMYDRYDLWKISTGNTPCERVTRGRENGTQFRLIDNITRSQSDMRNKRGEYLNEAVMLFRVRKGDTIGYACKKADGSMVYIMMEPCYTRWPKISLNNKVLGFTVENYDIPPRLMLYDAATDTLIQIFQSNPHYKDYHWHERKRITYHNKNGKKLTGILYYPMDYRQDSLYPMVVHVYEKQSHYWHQYITPTYYNPIGFNPANLTADGYFVFLPDIEYETGEPGFSASDCIISGTKAAMESAPVNPAKIGLMGQSFGGYETMFTITQTRLFATAIAGAGISDFPTDYFNIEGTTSRFYQYEDSQLRMKKSLFEDYQGYLDNSPQYHAQNIRIPFLLYTGGKDYHVHYTQTMAFHFAMKRLGKQNTMLIYPNEGHAFNDLANKKDLTIKVHQWFGHFLKGGEKQSWMP
ncbi:MAG: S9 family peptidase [Bacteroidales bacterium]|nr:S9 family peptidase [Bacteroidales bacterium]